MRANFAGADAAEQPVQTAEATGTITDESSVPVEGLQRGNIAADASSGDAMQHYLREISVAELLTREQEVELAQRIEAGRAAMLAAQNRELSAALHRGTGVQNVVEAALERGDVEVATWFHRKVPIDPRSYDEKRSVAARACGWQAEPRPRWCS